MMFNLWYITLGGDQTYQPPPITETHRLLQMEAACQIYGA